MVSPVGSAANGPALSLLFVFALVDVGRRLLEVRQRIERLVFCIVDVVETMLEQFLNRLHAHV